MSGPSGNAKDESTQRAEPRLECPACKVVVSALDFLADITKYQSAERRGEGSCPACRQSIEFRFFGPRFELGYTYWAGALHFDAMADVWLSGLMLENTKDGCFAVIDDRRFRLPTLSPPLGQPTGS